MTFDKTTTTIKKKTFCCHCILSMTFFCISDIKKLTDFVAYVTTSLHSIKSLFEPYCCDVVSKFRLCYLGAWRQKMLWARRALRTCLCRALELRVPECEVWSWILTIIRQSRSHGSSCTGSVLSPSEESLQIRVSMIVLSFQ